MNRLSDTAIAEVLANNGVGVLAFEGDGGGPYPIPVAFGYDPETDLLGLQLEGDERNEKHRRRARNSTVGFTVYEETEPDSVWRSVVVSGELVETTYDRIEPVFAALATRSQSTPDPNCWSGAENVDPFELRIEDWSGRRFDV